LKEVKPMTQALGVHYLLELRDCDPRIIDDLPEVQRILLEAARRSRATIIDTVFRKFSPQGISGVVIIAESHFSIHTWPEYRYAAVDIYTCGRIDPLSAVGYMIEQFRSGNPAFVMLKRGLLPQPFEDLQFRLGRPRLPLQEDPNEISEWFFLDFINPSSANLIKARRLIFSARSAYQEIEILDTQAFGKCLMLDGRMQSAQVDEFIYHEALVHPAMVTHPNPESVLIVGGGEGATLREVLRHRTVRRAVMVDIDRQVVEACRLFLPEWSDGAFEDPRTELVIDDARHYLMTTDDQFDVIIMDITEPLENGPSAPLVTYEMFQIVRSHLRPLGIVVHQSGSTGISELHFFASMYKTLQAVFRYVAPYSIQITSFAMPWGFVIASDALDPRTLAPDEVDRRLRARCDVEKLRFYDGTIHQAILALPRYMRAILEEQGQVLYDAGPPLYRSIDYAITIG